MCFPPFVSVALGIDISRWPVAVPIQQIFSPFLHSHWPWCCLFQHRTKPAHQPVSSRVTVKPALSCPWSPSLSAAPASALFLLKITSHLHASCTQEIPETWKMGIELLEWSLSTALCYSFAALTSEPGKLQTTILPGRSEQLLRWTCILCLTLNSEWFKVNNFHSFIHSPCQTLGQLLACHNQSLFFYSIYC